MEPIAQPAGTGGTQTFRQPEHRHTHDHEHGHELHGHDADAAKRARQFAALAQRLWEAEQIAQPIARLRTLVPDLDITGGYTIRREVDLLRMDEGALPAGRKIGLTARELLARAGADEPFWAYIFTHGEYADGARLNLNCFTRPVLLEPELAVVLGRDLDELEPGAEQLFAAIESVRPAFEIIDRRTTLDDLDVAEVVADSGWHGGYILGPAMSPAGIDLDAVAVEVHSTQQGRLAGGNASALVNGPLGCLAWLARRMAERGEPLRAGEIILTGTLAGALPLLPGDTISAGFTGLAPLPLTISVSAYGSA